MKTEIITKTPKDFIQDIYFHNLGKILTELNSTYISFAMMAIGIEFLGKCLDTSEQDWHAYRPGLPDFHFRKAISELHSFRLYRKYLKKEKLFDAFRNGFAHSLIPKKPILLTDGRPDKHLEYKDGVLTLNCESMYNDFIKACDDLFLLMEEPNKFASNDKIFQPVLMIRREIPD